MTLENWSQLTSMLFVSEIETQERWLDTSVLESEIISHVFKNYLEKIDREKQKICMFYKKEKKTKVFHGSHYTSVMRRPITYCDN